LRKVELEIETPDGRNLSLEFTGEYLAQSGQHGRRSIFVDKKTGQSWLLKIFPTPIDPDLRSIDPLPVDLGWSADVVRRRAQFARASCEAVASSLARALRLNVPEAFVLASERVTNLELSPKEIVPPEKGTIDLTYDDEDLEDHEEEEEERDVGYEDEETFEDVYALSEREDYVLRSARNWDAFLMEETRIENPEEVLALFVAQVPDARTIDEACDEAEDIDELFDELRHSDSGFYLLAFDVFLNDPDRNAGNYLLTREQDSAKGGPWRVYGIDYEMFAFAEGDRIDPDDITKGRSYLAAILCKNATPADPRVLRTLYDIRRLSEEDIIRISRIPLSMIRFVEFHIREERISDENRLVVRQVEENIKDFLWESKPRMSLLEENIEFQLG